MSRRASPGSRPEHAQGGLTSIMSAPPFAPNAQAILLLCAHLEGRSEVKPLTLTEYNTLALWLVGEGMTPGDLLSDRGRDAVESGLCPFPPRRIHGLLERGVALAFELEKWYQRGMWVVCRSDENYPSRLRSHLRQQAPAFLIGIGAPNLLAGGGLAIVGSRNVDAEGENFTRAVARRCAEQGVTVVSGGARGVDQVAMLTALEQGGFAIGVLADSLSREMLSSRYRDHLIEGRLLLLSPYHPDARFSVGTAMGRNKLVYAMADQALVVACTAGEGGTWAGAIEELRRREAPRSVFIRQDNAGPSGTTALLPVGARLFPNEALSGSILEALGDVVSRETPSPDVDAHPPISPLPFARPTIVSRVEDNPRDLMKTESTSVVASSVLPSLEPPAAPTSRRNKAPRKSKPDGATSTRKKKVSQPENLTELRSVADPGSAKTDHRRGRSAKQKMEAPAEPKPDMKKGKTLESKKARVPKDGDPTTTVSIKRNKTSAKKNSIPASEPLDKKQNQDLEPECGLFPDSVTKDAPRRRSSPRSRKNSTEYSDLSAEGGTSTQEELDF